MYITKCLKIARKLKFYSVHIKDVDQATRHQIHDLWSRNLIGKTDYNEFISYCNNHNNLMFCQNQEGEVCGMGGYTVIPAVINQKTCYILRAGLGYIQKEYQAQGVFKKFLMYMIIKERFRHPFSNVYCVSRFLSASGYQATISISKRHYPRYDRPTPEEEQRVIDYCVSHIYNAVDCYDRKKGTINLSQSVKEELGAISERDMQDPHVKFFLERNPNWAKGNALVGMLKVSWKELIISSMTFVMKKFLKEFGKK